MNMPESQPTELRADVFNYDDIVRIAPSAEGHERFINWLLRLFCIDKINDSHRRLRHKPGPECFHRFLLEDLDVKLRIDNEQALDDLPEGSFITISNHPFGAIDGITLIHLITRHRPEFRVMVDYSLAQIPAMRPNFITVDAVASSEPEKKRISYNGIRTILRQIENGQPVGFFPAGAVSRINWRGRLNDRRWRTSVMQIIRRSNAPVLPVYFHGSNSWLFKIINRTPFLPASLLLPREMWKKKGKEIHVTIGNPIMPEEYLEKAATNRSLADYLRECTYRLKTMSADWSKTR